VAKWILVCPDCGLKFTHSNIEPKVLEQSRRDLFKIVAKPNFKDGERIGCPNCKVESVYEGFELIYDPKESGPAAMG
jgi:hypothetical protein